MNPFHAAFGSGRATRRVLEEAGFIFLDDSMVIYPAMDGRHHKASFIHTGNRLWKTESEHGHQRGITQHSSIHVPG